MSNWGLSHKGLRIRSVDKVAVLYLCIRAFQLLQRKGERETDTGFCRVRASGATGSLVKPWLRQAALPSGEDSIINDASTRSHLGFPYSSGGLLHLILARVRCGLSLKWYASHTLRVMHYEWWEGDAHILIFWERRERQHRIRQNVNIHHAKARHSGCTKLWREMSRLFISDIFVTLSSYKLTWLRLCRPSDGVSLSPASFRIFPSSYLLSFHLSTTSLSPL